ncbi:hypothetical protein GOBAR_DD34682 [Gossypium barbadense]|nr:hypothetical protein GOBAR_DD34682 [Gossypium barbadense]
MEESNNYGHQHPLLLILNEDQLIHNQSDITDCSRCAEKVSTPCFCCAEHCGFYLHKNNLKELDHVALQHPLISTENGDEELGDVSKCFGCWEPLAKYTHFSPDCRFNLHEKCAKLPFKLNHKCHHKHPLTLQFNSEPLSCKICGENNEEAIGFVYGCSPCKFGVHIECVSESLDLVVEDKRHEHPFTLLLRGSSFICDACGIEGSYAAYICCTCNIMVHKKCTSLPRIIKSKWHDHRLFHKYFLRIEDFRVLDCIICHDEVNIEHRCFSYFKCKHACLVK